MAFDGVVTKSVIAELQCLINGKINKIFEPNKNEILLGIYCNGKNYALNVSIDPANYRINLTTNSKPNPQNALNFCMVLRKHLTNGTIKKIYSNGLERIIFINIECRNEQREMVTKTLVIELMGKHSNIILLTSDGTVINSLRHLNRFDNSTRDIFPGSYYVNILSDKCEFENIKNFEEFYKLFDITNENVSICNTLASSVNGLGKSNILNLLNYLKIDNNSKNVEDFKLLYEYLKNIINVINSNDTSNINIIEVSNENKKDYFITFDENTKKENLKINFFLDDFYFTKEKTEEFKSYRDTTLRMVLSLINKEKEKLDNINKKIAECDKSDLYKLYGELITVNLYRIKDFPQSSITLENYYENNKQITIPLDGKTTPANNAKEFFKKYKKLQNTIKVVGKQKQLAEEELTYLESVVYELENIEDISEIENIYSEICDNFAFSKTANTVDNHINKIHKKEKEKSSFLPAKYEIDGYTVWVGKNNKQNDYLTCKMAQNSDIWFHTKDIHGSHVVVRPKKSGTGKLNLASCGVPDSVLYKCACLAAYYSKAKFSQNAPVDYTFIKYVKKPNGAKPGMVIYTDNKTIYANPQNKF